MRAMVYDRYGGPEGLRPADLPEPEPGPGEVLVRVAACSVNLSDWENLTGRPAYARLGGLRRPRRRVLGSDVVGHVVRLGPGVDDGPAVGERVMADVVMRGGGFAELARLPAAACTPVPAGLSDDVAACLPQSGPIAVQGMEGVAAGRRVLDQRGGWRLRHARAAAGQGGGRARDGGRQRREARPRSPGSVPTRCSTTG